MHSNSSLYLDHAKMRVRCDHVPSITTTLGITVDAYERVWIDGLSEDNTALSSVILTMTLEQLGELSQQIERHIQDRAFEEQSDALEAISE